MLRATPFDPHLCSQPHPVQTNMDPVGNCDIRTTIFPRPISGPITRSALPRVFCHFLTYIPVMGFKMMSINVKGLNHPANITQADIVCVQETHFHLNATPKCSHKDFPQFFSTHCFEEKAIKRSVVFSDTKRVHHLPSYIAGYHGKKHLKANNSNKQGQG